MLPLMRTRIVFVILNYWRGGCIIRDKSKALVYICPECQRAEKRWIREQKSK